MIEETNSRRSVADSDLEHDAGLRVPYVAPEITSFSSEEIEEQIGPAQACSPSPCGIF